MTRMREAACGCGEVRIACEGEPSLVSLCHCLECQRRTGSLFGVQAWFPRERVAPPAGPTRHYTRRGDSGLAVTFTFCPACGSTVSWVAEKVPDLVAVAVGAFADPTFPAPSRASFERRQHPWTACLNGTIAQHLE